MKTVILTEGSKTEVIYFQALIDHLNCADIYVRPGKSPDPLRLLREAIQLKRKEHCEVWVVLDSEIPGQDRTRDRHLKKARIDGARFHIHFAVSEPCFEAWLLSHFNGTKNYNLKKDARFYADLLTKKLGKKYSKSDYRTEPFLQKENLQAAIASHIAMAGLGELTQTILAADQTKPDGSAGYRNGRISSSESMPSSTIKSRSIPTAIPPHSGIPRSRSDKKSSSSG